MNGYRDASFRDACKRMSRLWDLNLGVQFSIGRATDAIWKPSDPCDDCSHWAKGKHQ